MEALDANERILLDLRKRGTIPFTYHFLGLRLRLAFTKRRFEKVEASYHEHVENNNRVVSLLLEGSFQSLRQEISRIEEGQEEMRQRALPKVREQLELYQSFLAFLSGCACPHSPLKLLHCGEETSIGLKKVIAEFAGVPLGNEIHDLRSLQRLLIDDSSEKQFLPLLDESLDLVTSWGAEEERQEGAAA